jgi:uncharacterized protein YdeI (YjbR/CyaY-like superfamily)
MKMHSPQVDAYIAKSPEFARPILEKVGKLFHQACPEIEETIKWGFPHFEYKGIVGNMAAFKKHAAFGFWKAKLLPDPDGLLTGAQKEAMHMTRITDVSHLPPAKVLLEYIRAAVAINEEGIKAPPKKKKSKPPLEVPSDLAAALKKNKRAQATFDDFSPSNQREYVEWLTEAKQAATRDRRLATAIEWMSDGKPRNWKYMK